MAWCLNLVGVSIVRGKKHFFLEMSRESFMYAEVGK
jgi:hypothetical protein